MRATPHTLVLSTPMRYFAAVAEAGSVSRAAQQLHVAGSAVSRQVCALEDALGVALFERAQRGMRLTAAGERLAAQLRVMSDDAQQALAGVRGLHDESMRRVRLACTEGFAVGLLPAALASFRQRRPEALVELLVAAPDDASALLQRKQVDLCLRYAVGSSKGCTLHHDAAAPLAALMQADHPLARRRSITLAEAVRHPVLLGAPGTTARRLFDDACAAKGLRPDVAVVSNALAPLLALIGPREIALASLWSVAQWVAERPLVAVPFAAGELPSRRLQLLSLHGRELPPTAQALAQHLAAALKAAPAKRMRKALPAA